MANDQAQPLSPIELSDSPHCSICLEPIADDNSRSKVELRCRHLFHLDCIGSAFNAKGAMECPNCRRTEDGKWTLFPGGIDDDHTWDSDEDIHDDDFPPPEPILNVFQGHLHQASRHSNLPAAEISGGVQNGSGLHNAFQIISASITNIDLPCPPFFANFPFPPFSANFPCPHLMSMQAPMFTHVTNAINATRQADGMPLPPVPIEPVTLRPLVPPDCSFSRGYYDQDQVMRNQFPVHETPSYGNNDNYSPLQILVDVAEHGQHHHHSHGVVNYSSVNDTPLPREDDPSLELTLSYSVPRFDP